ncbi:hypothetical protein Pcinc_032950 [Petrolisthes cinctipes]|uniref:Uncharacterized protein n=1 Tax=Petrolisthes cinctipes TaxID=88211 RepID=A0AAE1ETE3_PETCI|nr:hypothetical protein Pcinc_032950 [Petrolisthes cinctipes]
MWLHFNHSSSPGLTHFLLLSALFSCPLPSSLALCPLLLPFALFSCPLPSSLALCPLILPFALFSCPLPSSLAFCSLLFLLPAYLCPKLSSPVLGSVLSFSTPSILIKLFLFSTSPVSTIPFLSLSHPTGNNRRQCNNLLQDLDLLLYVSRARVSAATIASRR